METLINYITSHTERGACTCGKCFDAPANPQEHQPNGHTADLVFFKVAAKNNPDSLRLRELIEQNNGGAFGDLNPLDGGEHSYIELGGWIGDQGLALTLMGLGSLVGLWKLITPRMLPIPEDLVQSMAGSGFITIQAEPNRSLKRAE